MKYRADIDGLRAVAVLSVVAYHIMPWVVPGGFIGVDVFFVISGFLITNILWGQLSRDTFSFADFYAKRIRRLFPALFTVILACSVFEILFGVPQEIYDFGVSAISAVFYFSNHYFLSKDSYFDEELETNPLLHTWSLSVEEQFYILFPALLVLLFRRGKGKESAIIGTLLVGSLLFSEIMLHLNSPVSFYVVLSRFWQFLFGALLAFIPMKNAVSKPFIEAIGWFGLGLLGFSFFYYSGLTPFPGINALVPTIGTLFVLYAGQHEGLWITRTLSISFARFFGKISYSLYLWHWPLIVFYKLEFSPEPSSVERYVLIIASILLAYLSWRFVEEPFRHVSVQKKRSWIYATAGVSSLILVLISVYFIQTEGIRARYSDEQLSYIEYLSYDADPVYRTDRCFLTKEAGSATMFDEKECIKISSDSPNVLIVGDSHAAQYYFALQQSFPDYSFSQINASGCRPLVSYRGEERCTDLMRMTFEEYIKAYAFDAVILAGRWELNDLSSLNPTMEAVSAHTDNVIVLGPIIEYSQALPRLLAQNNGSLVDIEEAQQYGEIERVDRRMENILADTHVEYYSILDTMCPEKKCILSTQEGVPMQFDSSHLTREGAIELVKLMVERGFLHELHSLASDF